MIDRVPENAGRIKLTPVDGLDNTYDMERADSPITEGTPLNKGTLCSDSVATRYGLTDETGTPSACLARSVQILEATVDVTNWSEESDDGWYTNQVTVEDMKEVYNPLLDLVITSAELAEDERSAFGVIMECETYDGYVVFKALEVPEMSFNVRFMGV